MGPDHGKRKPKHIGKIHVQRRTDDAVDRAHAERQKRVGKDLARGFLFKYVLQLDSPSKNQPRAAGQQRAAIQNARVQPVRKKPKSFAADTFAACFYTKGTSALRRA